jgi:hypothetical protein
VVVFCLAICLLIHAVRKRRQRRSHVITAFKGERVNPDGTRISSVHVSLTDVTKHVIDFHGTLTSSMLKEVDRTWSQDTESVYSSASFVNASDTNGTVGNGYDALVRVPADDTSEHVFDEPPRAFTPSSLSRYWKPQRDTDAGVRLAGGPHGTSYDEPELLPPAYSTTFR